ncbi:hypothetical protein GCM10027049_22240 [Mucilaginibacter puniceus]
MEQINISHIANLNNDYLRGIEFYKQELSIMQGRLEEIAADNTSKEVSQQVEHFQNQFLIHSNYLDEIKHRIKSDLKSIESQLHKTRVFVSEDTAVEYDNVNEQYITEEKLFNEMRHEFNRFAAKWM